MNIIENIKISNNLSKEELLQNRNRLNKIINDLNIILNDDFIKENGYKFNLISKKNDRNVKALSLLTIFDLPVIIVLMPFVSYTIRMIFFLMLVSCLFSTMLSIKYKNEYMRKYKNIELYNIYYDGKKITDDIIIKDIELVKRKLLDIDKKLNNDIKYDNNITYGYIDLKRKVLVKRK